MKKIKVSSAAYSLTELSDIESWKEKIKSWVFKASEEKSNLILFPEYGGMELSSLLIENQRKDLINQHVFLKKYLTIFIEHFKSLAIEFKIIISAPSLPVFCELKQKVVNRTFCFSPGGNYDYQDKIFMTRFEDESWGVQSGGNKVKIFKTPHFSFCIMTCFDIEFPWPAIRASIAGAEIVLVPSCTETIKGANRVHIGAKARALENQNYTVVSQTVLNAEWSEAVDKNFGFVGFYSTPDVGLPDDGVLYNSAAQIEGLYSFDLNISLINKVRNQGAVFNFKKNVEFLTENESKLGKSLGEDLSIEVINFI